MENENSQVLSALPKRSELHLTRRLWHMMCGVFCVALHYIFDVEIKFWGYFSFAVAQLCVDLKN